MASVAAWLPAASLLLLLLLLPGVPGKSLQNLGAAQPVCTQAVYNWCSSWEAANTCEVTKRCSARWRNTNSRPVSVEVYYETLCPGCREFVVMDLFPVWVLVGDSVLNVTLVPFGNAKESYENGTWQFDCQHGELECKLNTVQACLLDIYKNDFSAAFPVINCMLSSSDIENSLEPCLKVYSPKTSVDEVMKCANGPQGNKLMHQNAQKTLNLSPPHKYTPWVLLEKKLLEDLDQLLKYVCQTYQGPLPAVCERNSFVFTE
ncbi:gamma-interferon-inducible lysosomal thiol reductase [Monodelphis domestica]|uniref:Gamma-interferon-inducible lysosomal thiol reductase n=1 Tax=Monodelphis domestica TaxID=13616 RepID=F6WUX5_MONDO|nr:gamma-interferon-inducible lysosomal thiol reductase [Monodelphis domestica]